MPPSLPSFCPQLSRRARRVLALGCAGLMLTAGTVLPGQLNKRDASAQATLLPPVQHPVVTASTTAPASPAITTAPVTPAPTTVVPQPVDTSTAATHPSTSASPSRPSTRHSATPEARTQPSATTPSAQSAPLDDTADPANVEPKTSKRHTAQANAHPAKAKSKAKPKTTTKPKAKPKAKPKTTTKPKPKAKPKTTTKTQTKAKPASNAVEAVSATSSTEADYANALLAMLNSERAAHGLRALRMNSHLITSARFHDMNMARANTMSHQLPGEANFADRIQNAGYNWVWAGENVGWNSDTSLAGVKLLESMMYNEKPPDDGHRQNILSTHFTEIGISVYFDNAHNKVWITEDFGSRS